MSRINLRSLLSEDADPKDAMRAVIADLQSLGLEVGRKRIIHLCAGDRLIVPRSGTVKLFVVSSVTSAASDGSNYFTVSLTRNGQAEAEISFVTSSNEITAYAEMSLGGLKCSQGDVLALQVVLTGSLYPIISPESLTLRAELSPREVI